MKRANIDKRKRGELKVRSHAYLYKSGEWIEGDLIVESSRIKITTNRGGIIYPLDNIEDLRMEKDGNKEYLTIDIGEDSLKLIIPKKSLSPIYRYLTFNIKFDKFLVYFLSPESRGGVFSMGVKWERGFIGIGKRAFWFLSREKQLRMGYDDISVIERDVRTIGEKERTVLVVNHVDRGEVMTTLILCPETTMALIEGYLTELTDKYKIKGEGLSDIEKEVATLVYSGIDSITIESMLGLDLDTLSRYCEKLEKFGLAKVVKVRKEVELTPKGVNFVRESAKKDSGLIDQIKEA